MNSRVIYKSMGGNTKLLSERISQILSCPNEALQEKTHVNENEVLFIGFWTDKGDCDEDMQAFLSSLHNHQIFLFGTAGYGGQQTYFDNILKRVKSHLDNSNQVIGTYMCQGKMPIGVKARYQKMLEEHPDDEHLKGMIDNFEVALTHPDNTDLKNLEKTILSVIKE